MPSLIVIEEMRAFLIEQGVVQSQADTPSMTVPSIWLSPRNGAPQPATENGNRLEAATVTLTDPNAMGPPGLEPWLEDTFVDITIRAWSASLPKLLHRTIRGLLAPVGERAGKKDWHMNNLRVLYSNVWRQEQALPAVEDGITYDRMASYRITCARSDLAA